MKNIIFILLLFPIFAHTQKIKLIYLNGAAYVSQIDTIINEVNDSIYFIITDTKKPVLIYLDELEDKIIYKNNKIEGKKSEIKNIENDIYFLKSDLDELLAIKLSLIKN